MMQAQDLKGVIAAIPTPFNESDEVDVPALQAIARYVIDAGVHGIMTTGGTGEFPSLSRQERRLVAGVVVEEAKGHVPVIAGTAACSTKETILLSEDAKEAGADAVIVTPPYYFRLAETSLLEHYRLLANAIRFPVVLYNNPLYTGNNLSPELIARLSEVDGIIGLKQSNPDLGQFVEVVRLVGERISVCTGIDSQFYAALCVGGKGIFSTAASVIPREMVQLHAHVASGSYTAACQLHMRVQGLNRFLEYDPGYVSPCKEALTLLGMRTGHVRKPLPDLDEKQRQAIGQALRELGYKTI